MLKKRDYPIFQKVKKARSLFLIRLGKVFLMIVSLSGIMGGTVSCLAKQNNHPIHTDKKPPIEYEEEKMDQIKAPVLKKVPLFAKPEKLRSDHQNLTPKADFYDESQDKSFNKPSQLGGHSFSQDTLKSASKHPARENVRSFMKQKREEDSLLAEKPPLKDSIYDPASPGPLMGNPPKDNNYRTPQFKKSIK